jgi:hypothetical protein
MGTPPGSRQEGRIERGEIPAIVFVRETSLAGTLPMITGFDRVLEKLFEEGWGDELSEHLQSYRGLDEVTGVGISKPLSEKGRTAFKPMQERCSILCRVG